MRLGNLHMINRSVDELGKLKAMLATKVIVLQLYNGWSTTHLDDTYIELVRPVIQGEIRARIRRIEADLVAMGVELDASAADAPA